MKKTNSHGLALSPEVLLVDPYCHKPRMVERGKVKSPVYYSSYGNSRFFGKAAVIQEHKYFVPNYVSHITLKPLRSS